jgi:hypothetical protein
LIWRYEFVATRLSLAGSLVIDDGGCRAQHLEDAQAVLGCAARNIKVSADTRPDVIRPVDPSGRDVMRLPLTTCEVEPQALPLFV